MGVELTRSGVDDDAFAEMRTFVRDYLRASVGNEETGSRMRWYPWHSAAYRFNHSLNVVDLGTDLARDEDAEVDVVRVAALFHDVAKLEADQETHADEGARVTREYLENRGDYAPTFVDDVCDAIANHTFEGDLSTLDPETRTLIEADMLDKVGANGALLLFLRMGYEARTHMDAAEMVDRVVERGENVAERVVSDAAESVLHRRLNRTRWLRDWLQEEVAAMEA